MKAVILKGFGGREVLGIGDVDRPSQKANQVSIQVKATSVNRADIVQREGNYPPPPGESEILGLEVAGIIEEAGESVTGWKKGDRVMTLVGGGGYAEYAVAYADHLIPIPETIDFRTAACICEVYITAFLNIFLNGRLKDGERILLHGGGGGVNTAAIQLCRALTPKAMIYVTASPNKVKPVQALGADFVINYKEKDFAGEILSHTENKGVDVILDHIGAGYLQANLKALSLYGRLVVIGVMGGAAAELNLARLMVKRQQIIGSVLRARPVAEKADIISEFKKTVMPIIADGSIAPMIHKVFPLDAAAEAHRTMEESLHFGKIVIDVK